MQLRVAEEKNQELARQVEFLETKVMVWHNEEGES